MDAIVAVEKEIDKIVSKFGSIREHGTKNIDETLEFLSSIKPELEQGKIKWVMCNFVHLYFTLYVCHSY